MAAASSSGVSDAPPSAGAAEPGSVAVTAIQMTAPVVRPGLRRMRNWTVYKAPDTNRIWFFHAGTQKIDATNGDHDEWFYADASEDFGWTLVSSDRGDMFHHGATGRFFYPDEVAKEGNCRWRMESGDGPRIKVLPDVFFDPGWYKLQMRRTQEAYANGNEDLAVQIEEETRLGRVAVGFEEERSGDGDRYTDYNHAGDLSSGARAPQQCAGCPRVCYLGTVCHRCGQKFCTMGCKGRHMSRCPGPPDQLPIVT